MPHPAERVTMTKQELIERVYRSVRSKNGVPDELTKKNVQQLVDTLFEELSDYFVKAKLTRSESPKLTIPAFGTFTKRRRAERPGRNPQTGATITIPATVTVAFTPGLDLKESLNRSK
jgi:nucleoid DNA-binding protein